MVNKQCKKTTQTYYHHDLRGGTDRPEEVFEKSKVSHDGEDDDYNSGQPGQTDMEDNPHSLFIL